MYRHFCCIASRSPGCEGREAGAVATVIGEERKEAKYLDLAQMHHFTVVVVEVAGAMGSDVLDVFVDFDSRESGDLWPTSTGRPFSCFGIYN